MKLTGIDCEGEKTVKENRKEDNDSKKKDSFVLLRKSDRLFHMKEKYSHYHFP